MPWKKQGLIFAPDNLYPWMVSHTQTPVVEVLDDSRWRIYFGTRSVDNLTAGGFIEVAADDPKNVLYVHDQPILTRGKPGAFDDGGTLPCSLVKHDSLHYLYYVGVNASVVVSYRNAVGLAISRDGGYTFERAFEGPVVDRSLHEPYFTASPFALRDEDGTWKMWYASATEWVWVHHKYEPRYQIKYATSPDGMIWTQHNITCIPYKTPLEANARPWVIKEDGIYKMWYCYRDSVDYRTDPTKSYRLGYAESSDGIQWERLDEQAGIEHSTEGWDALMIAYPCVLVHQGRKLLFYNGNGFGQSGVGYAIWEDE